jgi:hypothetical protein
MASLISERDVAKLCLLMQQRFAPLIQFAEQQVEQVQSIEQKVAAQQTLDYAHALQDELVDVIREMAKDEPDKAKILGWASKWVEDEEDGEADNLG